MAVANRAMRPIAALTAAAGEIATTRDTSRRIPEPESDDEVAELARTLDQMLRELDDARSETESTIRRQREFVADASHELRTPLTSILANLELLEASLNTDGPDADEGETAAVASALRSSKRMNRLVGDLLLLARADAGRVGRRAECDLALIASEALIEVGPVSDGHRFTSTLVDSAPVAGNPDELHRMVLNLLENAVRHTPAGTAIDLELSEEAGVAHLRVSDDGPGLPDGMESQVFDRFVRGQGPADRTSRQRHRHRPRALDRASRRGRSRRHGHRSPQRVGGRRLRRHAAAAGRRRSLSELFRGFEDSFRSEVEYLPWTRQQPSRSSPIFDRGGN